MNYLKFWMIFLVLAVALYVMTTRMLFTSLVREGLRVGYTSTCCIVAGLFAVVVSFYAVFMFSPVMASAWVLEMSLLFIWFMFFIFSWVTAPPPQA